MGLFGGQHFNDIFNPRILGTGNHTNAMSEICVTQFGSMIFWKLSSWWVRSPSFMAPTKVKPSATGGESLYGTGGEEGLVRSCAGGLRV